MSRPTRHRRQDSVHAAALAIIVLAIIALAVCSPAYAQAKKQAPAPKQITFASSDEAVKVFVDALKANDTKKVLSILGPGSEEIVSSGDPVADRNVKETFLKHYDEKNRIEASAKKWVLYVGNDDWPFPIPVVKQGNTYRFDTKAGKREMLARRIGTNELSAIQVCLAYTDAQRDYALKDRDSDGVLEYAQKFMSAPGTKDGLYWETKEGEQQSPLGPLFAAAQERGYEKAVSGGKPVPYYGYYYRILKAQGKSAPGGAYNYVINGRMIAGFALVAYPADYGNSGVMTFIVSHNGKVYERDLGKQSAQVGAKMTAFDPGAGWKEVPR